jgi:hypothetical protein
VLKGKPHLEQVLFVIGLILEHLEHLTRIEYPHLSQTGLSPIEWQFGHSKDKTLWHTGHTVALSFMTLLHLGQFTFIPHAGILLPAI